MKHRPTKVIGSKYWKVCWPKSFAVAISSMMVMVERSGVSLNMPMK